MLNMPTITLNIPTYTIVCLYAYNRGYGHIEQRKSDIIVFFISF